jgi:hypothetical protein
MWPQQQREYKDYHRGIGQVLSIVIFIAHTGAFGVAPTHHRSVGGVISDYVSH